MINSEISMLIKLKSPNIIGFEEAIYFPDKQRVFIVLEYCSKGTILKYMQGSTTVSFAEWQIRVKPIMKQIAQGILKSRSIFIQCMRTTSSIEISRPKMCSLTRRTKLKSLTSMSHVKCLPMAGSLSLTSSSALKLMLLLSLFCPTINLGKLMVD